MADVRAQSRWIMAWGFDGGEIVFYDTIRRLKNNEVECDEVGISAENYFHAEAIELHRHRKLPYLELMPEDLSHRDALAKLIQAGMVDS